MLETTFSKAVRTENFSKTGADNEETDEKFYKSCEAWNQAKKISFQRRKSFEARKVVKNWDRTVQPRFKEILSTDACLKNNQTWK